MKKKVGQIKKHQHSHVQSLKKQQKNINVDVCIFHLYGGYDTKEVSISTPICKSAIV